MIIILKQMDWFFIQDKCLTRVTWQWRLAMPTDWNKEYRTRPESDWTSARDWLVDHRQLLPAGGRAFEAACGDGGNLNFLHQRGFSILAADYSVEGVRLAKHRCPQANVIRADLSRFRLPDASFDLIINFYYLEWNLVDQFSRALKPGGLLIFETMDVGILKVKPDINPLFLLQPGQLLQKFSGWDILDEREGWFKTDGGKRKSISSIVARRRV